MNEFCKDLINRVFLKIANCFLLGTVEFFKIERFFAILYIFRKRNVAFLSCLWEQRKTVENTLYFFAKISIESRKIVRFKKTRRFQVDKNLRFSKIPIFLNLGKSLWPKWGMVSDGAFFCKTELSTQDKEKWALATF